jgi:uncharacterized protein (DUF1697 family)
MTAGYVALLRGINLGGKNKLAMPAFSQMFAAAGCGMVKTYIQSGNVLFRATPKIAARLPVLIPAEIERAFGLRVPLLLRNAEQLQQVVQGNPFLKAGAPEDTLHVLFLAGAPAASDLARLDQERSPPDEFTVAGQEIYLRLPNGAGRTKLTNAYFDSKLATMSTGRNWRTVTTLLALLQG